MNCGIRNAALYISAVEGKMSIIPVPKSNLKCLYLWEDK